MKKISGIEGLVLPFPDTKKYLCLLLLHKHPSIHQEWYIHISYFKSYIATNTLIFTYYVTNRFQYVVKDASYQQVMLCPYAENNPFCFQVDFFKKQAYRYTTAAIDDVCPLFRACFWPSLLSESDYIPQNWFSYAGFYWVLPK